MSAPRCQFADKAPLSHPRCRALATWDVAGVVLCDEHLEWGRARGITANASRIGKPPDDDRMQRARGLLLLAALVRATPERAKEEGT